MEDLGKLQKEVMEAFPEAAKRQDGTALSVLGAIVGEMESNCRAWQTRFQRVMAVAGRTENVPATDRSTEHSQEQAAPTTEDFTGRPIRTFKFDGELETPVGSYREML